MNRALLLSGGIDSSAVAAWLHPEMAIVIDYGQLPARGEIRAAKAVANALNIPIFVLEIDCSKIGSGVLSGQDSLPLSPSKEWWPFRNQLLITLAGTWAISKGANELIVGSVKTDGFHVDGTEKFYNLIDNLLSIQEGRLRVRVPAISMTTTELIKISGITEELLGWTNSCHQSEWACGTCPGCLKHQKILLDLRSDLKWTL